MTKSFQRRLLLGGIAVLLIGGFLFVMLRAGPLAPIKVVLTEVKQGSFTPEIFGIGTVEARHNWTIAPTITARILRIHGDVGDSVKVGQVLVEMDSVDLEQRLNALDAILERAKSTQIASLAQRTDAAARRELAESALRRNQELADKKFISSGALEIKIQEKTSADAAFSVASANAMGATQDLQRAKSEKAALQQQRINLRLMATTDGVITTREAEPGNVVLAGQPVLRIIDPHSLWVKLRIDQGRSTGLTQGLRARIVLRSLPNTSLMGSVVRVERISDSITEERIAQITFDTLPAAISVGEMAEATLALAPLPPSLLIPAASVVRQGSNNGVWRMESGKPTFTPIQIGAMSLAGDIQVLKGLQVGDSIIVYSQKPLAADARIQVVESLGKAP